MLIVKEYRDVHEFAQAILDVYTTTPEGLAEFQRAETEKWGRIIKGAGIEPEESPRSRGSGGSTSQSIKDPKTWRDRFKACAFSISPRS